jgi:centrin-1
MTPAVTENDSKLDMKRLFNLYDDDRNGFLTKEKLRHIADEYGIWVTNDDLELMIVTANQTKDGKVTEEEFYRMMAKQH